MMPFDSRPARRVAGAAARMVIVAVFALSYAGTAHGQASCGNRACEPQFGEFDARYIPQNYCSVDCYCGNGSCDIPTGLDQVDPGQHSLVTETAANCPADCSTGNDCPGHYPFCSQIEGSPDQVPCPPGTVPNFLLGPHAPSCRTPDGLLPGSCFKCVPIEPPACSNGVDDDGDGATDYPADADCATAGSGSEAGPGDDDDGGGGESGGEEGEGDGDGDGGDGDEAEPPMCTGQPCESDADCSGSITCDRDPADPTKDACWMEEGTCVKKCEIPRCINERCAMAAPLGTPTAPYTPCDVSVCPAARCGDKLVQPSEECDDGNDQPNDGCTAACKKEVCGDGVVQAKGADGLPNTADDEACDDGNRDPADGCNNTCKKELCGNGVRDTGEECDEGKNNSDTRPGACRTTCLQPDCGDGIVDAPWGEQCDCGFKFDSSDPTKWYCDATVDGHAATCHAGMCIGFYCGDGQTFPAGIDRVSGTPDDEMCDAGPLNSNTPLGSGECDNNAQCSGGVCVAGECKSDRACSADADCGGGKCLGSRCRAGGCVEPSDCQEGFVCDHGTCESPIGSPDEGLCTQDSDCPSGFCRPTGACYVPPATPPEGGSGLGCRLDCKWSRCGDGIIDETVGETCDDGAAMFECQGWPQPSCSCAIPTWSGTVNGGETYDMTCCGDLGKCVVGGSETCPVGCGITAVCGNGRVEGGEECDTSSFGSDIVFRVNGDGTRASYAEDDGRWIAIPRSIEDKYTAIDHTPGETDDAHIRSAPSGLSTTYFHLWDVPVQAPGAAQEIVLHISVDFGDGMWRTMEVSLPLDPGQRPSVGDMNASALIIQANADRHELIFTLVQSSRGTVLGGPVTLPSPVAIPSPAAIGIDALELAALSDSPDAADCHDCELKRCGNFRLESEIGEQCDDGNAAAGDGCTDRCQHEICALPE